MSNHLDFISKRHEQKLCNFKLNPHIFGFTSTHIYLCNYNKVFIMCRNTGLVVKCMELSGNRPYFLLDKQNNIILVDKLDKRVQLLNSNLESLIENIYSDDLDSVFLLQNNRLALVDTEKKYVVFV